MKDESKELKMNEAHSQQIISAFGKEIEECNIDTQFRQPQENIDFFLKVITDQIGHQDAPLAILECGTGTGFWLSQIADIFDRAVLSGFDLTPQMIEVARNRLEETANPVSLKVGDISEQSSFIFSVDRQVFEEFDIIFAYDVIQQLPGSLRPRAIQNMLSKLKRAGKVIIFDHDMFSFHGMKMWLKKKITKYLYIPLVPRYYCLASYPDIRCMARQVERQGYRTEIMRSSDVHKQALIITRQSEI